MVELIRLFAELLHDYKAAFEVGIAKDLLLPEEFDKCEFLIARCEDFFDRLGVRPPIIDMEDTQLPC